MLDEGIIEPSTSSWSSLVVTVKNPNDKYQMCIDFRFLKKATETCASICDSANGSDLKEAPEDQVHFDFRVIASLSPN